MNSYLKYILMLLIVTVAAYAAQYLIIRGLNLSELWNESGYSQNSLYLFGVISSLVVTVAIVAVGWSMPKSLGLVFLALVFLKGVAGYVFIRNGLNKFDNDFIEYNFLAVFFIYMFFDVFVAFKTLNEGDKTV